MSEGVLRRVGFYLWPFGPRARTLESLVDMALFAETLGADAVFLPWHYTLPSVRTFATFGNAEMPDPLVILPALLQATRRIRVGLNALVLPLFHPFAVAKYFATLDWGTGGRVILAVTTGWWEEDFKAAGIPPGERGKRMDEAVQTIDALWSDRDVTQAGHFWDVRGLKIRPLPVQRPFPLWIGGGAKAIRRAARWGHVFCPHQNSSLEMIRSVYRAGLDRAEQEHGRHVQIAAVHSVMVTGDRDLRTCDRMLRMRACMRTRQPGELADRASASAPENPVIWGSAADCADALQTRIDAGVDYVITDCYFNGMGDEAFAKDQMAAFAQDVAPRLRW